MSDMVEVNNPKQIADEGQNAYKRGDFNESAHLFDAAAQGFQIQGDLVKAAELRNNASVAYLKCGDAQASLDAVEGTASIFSDIGDLRRQGMALGNYGAALEALGRLDEAAFSYETSAELLSQSGEDVLRAEVLQSLSAIQLRKGKQLQALATMQSGINGIKRPSPKQKILKSLMRFPFRLMK
jgi:tetratricopeptide (TPR) repeat protein